MTWFSPRAVAVPAGEKGKESRTLNPSFPLHCSLKRKCNNMSDEIAFYDGESRFPIREYQFPNREFRFPIGELNMLDTKCQIPH